MEISNEIKAKVFASYLGQQTTLGDLRQVGLLSGILIVDSYGNGLTPDISSVKLILKPLSAITDEDAIKVAKILYKEIFISVETREHDNQKIVRGQNGISVMIFDDGSGFNVYDSNDMLREFHQSGDTNLFAYQYLQSKGYDLPHYLLGGKTLQEAGLAIYK